MDINELDFILQEGEGLKIEFKENFDAKFDYLIPNISNNCLGDNILTWDCCFNFLSPENIGQSSFNANAKYGESLKLSCIASGNLSKNSEEEINSTCSFINEITFNNSSFDNSVSSDILSNFLLISVNKNSGAINSNLFRTLLASKTLKGLPLLINDENTTLTSITNNIIYPSFNNFSYFLANDKLVSSDNSLACSWVNLDLSTIDLIIANLSNFSFNIFPIANCQFILDIEANSSNSSGISIFVCAIKHDNNNGYLNFSLLKYVILSIVKKMGEGWDKIIDSIKKHSLKPKLPEIIDMSKILFAQSLGFNPRIAKEFWSMLKNPIRPRIYSRVLDSGGNTIITLFSPDEMIKAEKGVENLSDNEIIILNLVGKNPVISKEEMMIQGNLTKKTVEYNVDKLKQKGLLKRAGPDKGGHWEILGGFPKSLP